MKRRTKIIIVIVLIIALLANTFVYVSIINGSGTISRILKKVNYAYVTPMTYLNIAKKLQSKPDKGTNTVKSAPGSIPDKSSDFVKAAFEKNDARINELLDPAAKYIRSKDGSRFIRYAEAGGIHVEGYMATDKKLITAKQKWYISEDDNTITSCIEVYIDGNKSPELWYIHFRKVKDDWKIFMLENNI